MGLWMRQLNQIGIQSGATGTAETHRIVGRGDPLCKLNKSWLLPQTQFTTTVPSVGNSPSSNGAGRLVVVSEAPLGGMRSTHVFNIHLRGQSQAKYACQASYLRFPIGISMKIGQIASTPTSSTVAASHWSHNAP